MENLISNLPSHELSTSTCSESGAEGVSLREEVEIFRFQVKREFLDSGLIQKVNLVRSSESEDFVLPHAKSKDKLHHETEPKKDPDFEISAQTEHVLGSCDDKEVRSNSIKLEPSDLNPSLGTCDLALAIHASDTAFEDPSATYAERVQVPCSNSEIHQFIPPNEEMHIKTEIKEEMPEPEYLLGLSSGDEFAPVAMKLEPDVTSFSENLKSLESEMECDDSSTTQPQDRLDDEPKKVRKKNTKQKQFRIREDSSSQSTIQEKLYTFDQECNELFEVDNGLTLQPTLKASLQNSDSFAKPCAVRRNSSSNKFPLVGQSCLHCKKMCRSFEDLRKHHLSHESVQITNKCLACSKVFSKFEILQQHVKGHDFEKRNGKMRSSSALSLHEILPLDHNNAKELLPNSCLFRHKTEYSLERPAKQFQSTRVTPVATQFEMKLRPRAEDKTLRGYSRKESVCETSLKLIPKSYSTTKPLTHKCSHYGKDYSKIDGLKMYGLKHLEGKNVNCSHCAQVNQDKDHIVRPFICSECGKIFSTRGYLNKHLLIHSQENNYPCSECGMVFWDKRYLKSHFRVHSGEKPFVCSHCGEAFTSGIRLRYHLKSHTRESPINEAFVERHLGESMF